MKKIITVLLITILIFINGCGEKPLGILSSDPIEINMEEEFDPYSVFDKIQDGVEVSYELDEKNSKITFIIVKGDKKEVFEDIDVTLVYPELAAPFKAESIADIEIYSEPTEESLLKGYVRQGDRFEVLEIKQADDDIWCRIAKDHWINNKNKDLLEIIPKDEDISYIKDEISFESFPDALTGVFYERYLDGVPIIDQRKNAEKVENEYDDKNRLVSETLYMPWGSKEIYKYSYDSDNHIVYAKIDTYDDNGAGYDVAYSFAFDEKGKLVSESELDTDGNAYLTVYHNYDENGNIIELYSAPYDNFSLLFEYNGNLRFEYNAIIEENNPYTKDSYFLRYDKNGIMIEYFFACHGDIRNEIDGYK